MKKNYKFITYFVVKNGGQRPRGSVGMQVEIYYKEVGRGLDVIDFALLQWRLAGNRVVNFYYSRSLI
jgi:hypothetical protein